MNRINRVTSILIQLQSKKIIPAKEIAQRFNISLRTVYRDIRTLEEAGIPIDHSFLNYKKELQNYGFKVGKISLKEQTVTFGKE